MRWAILRVMLPKREPSARERIAQMPAHTSEVYLVLVEDRYETTFGDGYFAYLRGAFWAREQALAFASTWPELLPQQLGEVAHIRKCLLQVAQDGCDVQNLPQNESASPHEILALLDQTPWPY